MIINKMFTEEQYQTYANFLNKMGQESLLDYSTYDESENWLKESNITIAIQNAMDERFSVENIEQ